MLTGVTGRLSDRDRSRRTFRVLRWTESKRRMENNPKTPHLRSVSTLAKGLAEKGKETHGSCRMRLWLRADVSPVSGWWKVELLWWWLRRRTRVRNISYKHALKPPLHP